jgi:4-diphosphocytidyl-2-C-methyl-D-erythritol kinase
VVRALSVPAYAKVNLGLEVLGVREDGYHELRTLFQSIDLHDDVLLAPVRSCVSVRCDHPGVPSDSRNLAVRAAEELIRRSGARRGVAITIRKRIPVAGGLGGGSSDAAAVLRGLDHLWGLGLGLDGLLPLARRLGADVPYFLYGGTCLGVGRGDELYPLRDQVRAHLVLADPGRPLSTAEVFRRLDAQLTPRGNSLTISRFVSSSVEGRAVFRVLANDLESAALQQAPDLADPVRRIRGILLEAGAALAALSGSGAAYFGLFEEAACASRALAALGAAGFAALRARTLTFGQYRRAWQRSLTAAPGGTPSRGRG